MKLHSLLLPLIVIGSAIAPILSLSLPAQSEPPSKANIALAQQQVDEVIDFGIRKIGERPSPLQRPSKIDVTVPLGHSKFVVTPPNPFRMNTHLGQIDANRHGEIDVSLDSSELSHGTHQKVVIILTEKKLIIKRVLLKVKVIDPTVPSNPNGPQPRP
jgi:hypothetical protein